MKTNISTRQIPKESFLFACEICESDKLSITHRAANCYADEMTDLVANDAFAKDSLGYCFNKDGDEENLYFENKKPGYYDEDGNFISVSFENFTKYNLKLDWIIKNISNDCGVSFLKDSEEIIPNLLWLIGFIDLDLEVPVFFARKITKENIFDKINRALSSRKSSFEGIILSSCNYIPSHIYSKIAGHKIISLKNCLSANKEDFNIDKNILKNAVMKTGKEGFTTGYRSAYFHGEYFRFTKQEADVLEFLHNAGKPVHKDEIMTEITESDTTELRVLFRTPDSKNIRKNILQHDTKGYYWLNLD